MTKNELIEILQAIPGNPKISIFGYGMEYPIDYGLEVIQSEKGLRISDENDY